ncbi:hypothetical protein [Ruminococcus sp.]|uniref:hypothetical protein n=1 Tax=Ruminococcus sp. TaxID=41978 RepID=UPI002E7FB50F|nr:hypothetical protein [Ruminococcus sp.]MEE3492946.1 hypothetical protein [Ruminococcus sp.]
MKTIKELASTGERVYVHLKDEETAMSFLRQAESEGFTFGDGVSPTNRHCSDLYAIHPDGTLNYVGSVGRIEYASGADSCVRVEYQEML